MCIPNNVHVCGGREKGASAKKVLKNFMYPKFGLYWLEIFQTKQDTMYKIILLSNISSFTLCISVCFKI